MILRIDNYHGAGLRDYTGNIDAESAPRLTRKLNAPAELRFALISVGGNFVVPAQGGRVVMAKANGQDLFTGYIVAAPKFEYLGWGERGPSYRYAVVARSDESRLEEKRLPARSHFIARTAGDVMRQLTGTAMAGAFDVSAVQDLDVVPSYAPDPQLTWTQHAAAVADLGRATYRTMNGALFFAAAGTPAYSLAESDPQVTPENLLIQPGAALINDATLVGEVEPQALVKDYFVGDGLTSRFHLSQTPFTKSNTTIFTEEYKTASFDPTRWVSTDPGGALSISAGKLQVAGGNGADGATTLIFAEKVELGGATVLQHGDVVFNSASAGILGGLYLGNVLSTHCVAGFQVSPSGTASQIQAFVSGTVTGAPLATTAGHHYSLTTRIYSQQIYRMQQVFHSAANPGGGGGIGGGQISADVRLVLEVHDIDPANPGSMVTASTVLFDGVVSGAPAFCTYALVNSPALFCSIAFTRMLAAADTVVRSALPGQPYRTRLVGPLSTGGECNIYSGPILDFFSRYIPALNELLEVHYRGRARAMARVTNPASVAAQAQGTDDGVRAIVRHVKRPQARTSVDCENAAVALLSDAATSGWSGRYDTWSDFLPGGATDIFPGDALNLNFPSRAAVFASIVNEVEIQFADLGGEHSQYSIKFADAAEKNPAFEFDPSKTAAALNVPAINVAQVGATTLPDLTLALITGVASTTANIDAGVAPPSGGGFEVRWSDSGWGPYNDQNLAGRFTSQNFTVPRLAKVQDYFLRQFDASNPPKYSRFSTALHIDYPS
jgi:hypothetical protein